MSSIIYENVVLNELGIGFNTKIIVKTANASIMKQISKYTKILDSTIIQDSDFKNIYNSIQNKSAYNTNIHTTHFIVLKNALEDINKMINYISNYNSVISYVKSSGLKNSTNNANTLSTILNYNFDKNPINAKNKNSNKIIVYALKRNDDVYSLPFVKTNKYFNDSKEKHSFASVNRNDNCDIDFTLNNNSAAYVLDILNFIKTNGFSKLSKELKSFAASLNDTYYENLIKSARSNFLSSDVMLSIIIQMSMNILAIVDNTILEIPKFYNDLKTSLNNK